MADVAVTEIRDLKSFEVGAQRPCYLVSSGSISCGCPSRLLSTPCVDQSVATRSTVLYLVVVSHLQSSDGVTSYF